MTTYQGKKVGTIPIITNESGVRRLLGVTKLTLQDWINKGLPSLDAGVFNTAGVVSWYKLETAVGKRTKTNIEKDASERVLVAKAEKLERDNLVESGDLVAIADIQAAFEASAVIVANAFESLGARLANQVAGMDEPAEIQALIWNESREVRRLIADKFDNISINSEV